MAHGTLHLLGGAKQVISGAVGEIKYMSSAAVPAHCLPCDGAAVSRTTYANLFEKIGTTYGAGDGATTFNVPDLRGKFVRGLGGNAAELGIAQGDAIRNITGTAIVDPFTTSAANIRATTGALATPQETTAIYNCARMNTIQGKSTLMFNAANVVPTAAENRPVNMAMQAVIVYE